MATIQAKNTRIRVSTTEAGTYNLVGYVRSGEITEGSEGDSTLYYFGGEISVAGNSTLSGSINVYWDPADTTGQTILRTAKRNGTTVWIEFLPAGTTSGSPYERFEAVVTEVSRSSAADGDNVEGSFSFRGTPSTFTTGTIA